MRPDTEFAEEYTKTERIRFVVVGTLFGAIAVILSKTFLFPWIKEFAVSAPCRKVFGIEGLTVLWYGLFVGIPLNATLLVGIAFGWSGYKILRDSQFPPDKEKVYRPTKILRGPKARLIGYMYLSAFLPFLALTVWGSFQADEMSRTKQPKVGVCTANKSANMDTHLRASASRRLLVASYRQTSRVNVNWFEWPLCPRL